MQFGKNVHENHSCMFFSNCTRKPSLRQSKYVANQFTWFLKRIPRNLYLLIKSSIIKTTIPGDGGRLYTNFVEPADWYGIAFTWTKETLSCQSQISVEFVYCIFDEISSLFSVDYWTALISTSTSHWMCCDELKRPFLSIKNQQE